MRSSHRRLWRYLRVFGGKKEEFGIEGAGFHHARLQVLNGVIGESDSPYLPLDLEVEDKCGLLQKTMMRSYPLLRDEDSDGELRAAASDTDRVCVVRRKVLGRKAKTKTYTDSLDDVGPSGHLRLEGPQEEMKEESRPETTLARRGRKGDKYVEGEGGGGGRGAPAGGIPRGGGRKGQR